MLKQNQEFIFQESGNWNKEPLGGIKIQKSLSSS